MSSSSVISIRDLSFRYNGDTVLDNASFDVAANDYIWIVGPNGGGKTTLLKLILGLLKPSKGTVELFGNLSRDQLSRIGYMTQHAELDWQYPLSVIDVALMGRIKNDSFGFMSKADRAAAQSALDEVGLGDMRDRPFSELSGGQRRRLLIARALSANPDLLILDEPTANLDQKATQELYNLLTRLNDRLTIIMVSHDPSFVASTVDRVLCVNRHVHEHPVSDVNAEYLGHLYGAPVKMVRHDKDIEG